MRKVKIFILASLPILFISTTLAQEYQLKVIDNVKIKPAKQSNVPTCSENKAVGEIDCFERLYVNRTKLEDLINGKTVNANDGTPFTGFGDQTINTFYITDMSYLFERDYSIYSNISLWDTSNVNNMANMFDGAGSFNQDISQWDTSNVTNMAHMFNTANQFNQPIGNWDVSNVTNMEYMFESNGAFNQPLNNWDTSSLTNISYMFKQSVYNQPLNNWNTTNVTNMRSMFYFSDYNQPLDQWNVVNTSKIGMNNMFEGAETYQDISGWCVEHIPSSPTSFTSRGNMISAPLPQWGQPCN